ncbi:hypothetical protein BVRB_6g134960 [Beta vulgaris subsp. vulgaris]|nr:hypothetical protein BVRB_6g134960 [Beta vulgaris subsp. vulgaris]
MPCCRSYVRRCVELPPHCSARGCASSLHWSVDARRAPPCSAFIIIGRRRRCRSLASLLLFVQAQKLSRGLVL